MTPDREITILGAGIGGLTAALALRANGFDVTVWERAPAIEEVGAGLQISPNGMAVLGALGLGEAIAARGLRARAVELRDGPTGAGVARLNVGAGVAGRGYYLMHRADLIRLLADTARAAGARIELGAEVASVTATPDGAQVSMADGTRRQAGCLVGADGIRSVTRGAVVTPAPPSFSGQVAWRAMVPGGGGPTDGGADVSVYMGAGRHLVVYPLRDRALINIVAVEERREWADEGWFTPDDPDNLTRAFAGFATEVRGLLARVETVHIWGLFRHPVAPRWSRGGVFLLGDAAHPTLPFLAQGANMAIEDAWVLAAHLASAPDLEAAGLAYADARYDRVVRTVDAATANARNYHLSPGPRRAVGHTALRLANRFAPSALTGRFDWLYGHDVTQTET